MEANSIAGLAAVNKALDLQPTGQIIIASPRVGYLLAVKYTTSSDFR